MSTRSRSFRAVLAAAVALASLGCQPRSSSPRIPPFPPQPTYSLAEEPRLGAPSPIQAETRYLTLAASAQMYPSYRVAYRGVLFELGVDDRHVIRYIDTVDRHFKTPEGIAIGSPRADVMKLATNPLFPEPGWGCHALLPSGWRAAFDIQDGPDHCGQQVKWLFQRAS